ncbi:nitroreductase family protein [Sediminibacillus sp. JSM 1682029]|uniref:nitroreductase family protein n=1 Tax=Sediminibacillus sp. JSM 1682029 TaxID=3229857 RepID=UPI003524DEEC
MDVYQIIQEMQQENHERTIKNLKQISIHHSLLEDQKKYSSENLIHLEPPLQRSIQTLQDVLNQRTAIKKFESTPINLLDLSSILATIEKSDELNWGIFRELGIDLNIYILARNIENLTSPNIYKYIPSEHALSLVSKRNTTLKNKLDTIILQKEFIDAPALILCTGMVAASIDVLGNHGYRQMLVRGGNAMNTAWLATLSLGYQGSIFAGFYHDALVELFGFDGYKEMLLLAFAFGR